MMRAILTDESTPVYATIEEQSVSIATLHRDDEFELGKVLRRKRTVWVSVTLDSGVQGYISGDAHIFALKKVLLLDSEAQMLNGPSKDAELVKTLHKGDAFLTLKVEKTDEGGWVRVRDQSDTEGYIAGNTKIRILQQVKRSDATRTLVLGGLMTVIGVGFGAFSYLSKQQDTIAYYLAIGFIVFGVLQLAQGFIQYRQAVAQEKQESAKPGSFGAK